ncbi:MAG: metallophosphoesterase, partial [Planctomycetes bacterium]|nr:metallophosphoesterase [Planctomycetota bacterium]
MISRLMNLLRRKSTSRSQSTGQAALCLEPLEARRLLAVTRFGVIGDYGLDGPNEAAVADLVKSWDPDYVITVGDNNYALGEASTIDDNIGKHYQEFIGNYQGSFGTGSPSNRFFPALGNHDWETAGAQPYLDYFDLPGSGLSNSSGNERYYDFVQGPVHFFALDSDSREPDGQTSTSTQAQWLEQQLAASTAPFQVVYMHHAPYSSAEHGSNATLQWPFEQWGVDAVLAGHDHSYERLDIGGLPYFVNGVGGHSLRSFPTITAGSQVRYSDDFGAMLVTADETAMTFEFYAVGGGTLIDTYTVTVGNTADETLVAAGAEWNYLDDGTDQGTAWIEPTFNDGTWASGPAELGYGDGDESTVVSFGPDTSNKYVTTYFRKTLNVTDAADVLNLTLDLKRDDGAVVYLNGQEVIRSNMP